MTTATHPEGDGDTAPSLILTTVPIVSAVAIFALFTGLAGWLVWHIPDTGDDAWARMLTIFSSFEALAFAAAGLLLGERLNGRTLRALTASGKTIDNLRGSLAENEERLVGAARAIDARLAQAEAALAKAVPSDAVSSDAAPSIAGASATGEQADARSQDALAAVREARALAEGLRAGSRRNERDQRTQEAKPVTARAP